ncbi:MATE family efflux transporter [Pistricoccus aurantiacus]|uniref:MATE family efflux transporter n=1 Tax=Pistricoccus aurantiacus TaxID=1883414 RepID=A0A5B8SYE2_9GAMM|nr:MATE family efflux transporter [Pistricoccus aurantiacus]QEA39840.1 MATE family efflux transporter [Pistricoccus aurantiacus]
MSRSNAVDYSSSRALLDAPLTPLLIRKTLPVIGGMLAMMTFNLADAYFVSRLGTQPLAAVAFTFPVVFAVISTSVGMAIGTSAVIARLLGSGDSSLIARRATDAVLLSLIVGLLITLAGLPSVEALFTLLGADQALMPYIHQYMGVWYWGAALIMAPRVLNSILRAHGNTVMAGVGMAGAALLNIILDPLLIFGLGPIPAMGVSGAALATVISWGAVTLGLCFHPQLRRLIALKGLALSVLLDSWQKLGKIALPAAITSLFTPIAMALLTRIVASHGHDAVAAFGVGTRIDAIAQIVVLALSMTLSPVVSQNVGAGANERVRRAVFGCFAFVLVWQLLIWGLLQVLAPWITASYAETATVESVLRIFIWLVPLGLGAQGVIILSVSSLNAMHRPRKAMLLSLIRLFVLYVPLSWLGGKLVGIEGIFGGMLAANLIMGLVAWGYIRPVLRAGPRNDSPRVTQALKKTTSS